MRDGDSMIGSAMGTLVSTPCEVVKCTFQSGMYTASVKSALRAIHKESGFRGFYQVCFSAWHRLPSCVEPSGFALGHAFPLHLVSLACCYCLLLTTKGLWHTAVCASARWPHSGMYGSASP